MGRKVKKFRVILVMVTVIFLWCHSVQAMPMASPMNGMDCAQTQSCGPCSFFVPIVIPQMESGNQISFFIPFLQSLPEDPSPERLYHPPR